MQEQEISSKKKIYTFNFSLDRLLVDQEDNDRRGEKAVPFFTWVNGCRRLLDDMELMVSKRVSEDEVPIVDIARIEDLPDGFSQKFYMEVIAK